MQDMVPFHDRPGGTACRRGDCRSYTPQGFLWDLTRSSCCSLGVDNTPFQGWNPAVTPLSNVCICINIHTHTHTHNTHTHIHTTYTHTYTQHTYTQHTHTTHTHTHTTLNKYVLLQTHLSTHTPKTKLFRAHTHTCTYLHIYTHTHTNTPPQPTHTQQPISCRHMHTQHTGDW